MNVEQSLASVMAAARPSIMTGEYVFLPIENAYLAEYLDAAMVVVRSETQVTVVVPKAFAQAKKRCLESAYAAITLNVETSLALVGLTAKIATALAAQGVSCNVIAAYDRDYFFVPIERANEALAIIKAC